MADGRRTPRACAAATRRAGCLALAALAGTLPAAAQDAPDTAAFRVWTGTGEPSSLDALIDATGAVEVVLLGEGHNDITGHALQREILQRILARDSASRTVVLSLEMFERDVQYIVEEYLAGLISADQFSRSTRPWTHYDEDYSATVELARAAGIPVVAANAPRRYVNLVARAGADTLYALSDQARAYLPPLPWAPPSAPYLAELKATLGAHGDSAAARPEANDNGYLAQSLWDATMAFSIVEALLRRPDARIVHLVGSFHVKNGTGIPEHLERYRPGTRRLIVFVEPVADVTRFDPDLAGAGDFIILTDESRVRPPDPPR